MNPPADAGGTDLMAKSIPTCEDVLSHHLAEHQQKNEDDKQT
jgi:hypothetical protein